MSRRIHAALLTLTVLVLVGILCMPPALADTPLLEITVTGHNLTAGEENEMRIEIENIGDATAYDVKVRLTVPSTVTGISIVEESYAVYERIREDRTRSMYPVVYVASDCPIGAYSLTLELEYLDSLDAMYTDSLQIGVNVYAVKPIEIDLTVDVETYRITAGTENEILLTLTNVGEEAVFDVEVLLTSTTPNIVVLRETSYLLSEIDIGGRAEVRPILAVSQDTALGAYVLTLTLDYKDSNGLAYTKDLNVGVLVDTVEPADRTKIALQNVQITPYQVYPGSEAMVEIDLKNWGTNAYEVQVQLTMDASSPVVSLNPTLVFVGDLGSNQTAQVAYLLHISGDADASLYTLQLVISYYNVDNQPESFSEAISIAVYSLIDFRLLDLQPSTVTAIPGATVTIEADLLLLGTEPIDFVEIEIIENRSVGSLQTIPESYEYIGRIDPDSPVLFTIQFTVDSDATPGTYPLQMKISGWDGYNRQRQVMIEIPVVVNEAENPNDGSGSPFLELLGMILRILFGVKP